MMKMFGIAATAYIAYSISYIVKNDSKTQYAIRSTNDDILLVMRSVSFY
jgi:hypothetical protein